MCWNCKVVPTDPGPDHRSDRCSLEADEANGLCADNSTWLIEIPDEMYYNFRFVTVFAQAIDPAGNRGSVASLTIPIPPVATFTVLPPPLISDTWVFVQVVCSNVADGYFHGFRTTTSPKIASLPALLAAPSTTGSGAALTQGVNITGLTGGVYNITLTPIDTLGTAGATLFARFVVDANARSPSHVVLPVNNGSCR